MIDVVTSPATIGIIGGGQLGRMLTQSAKTMGYRVGILEPTPNSPAGQVADFQITAPYNDQAALTKLAKESDVLTYEFENVDLAALEAVRDLTRIPQGTAILATTRDRIKEKTFLQTHGVPVTPFAAVDRPEALTAAIEKIGLPSILKTTTGGYDGHGQQDINTMADVPAAEQLLAHGPCILEKRQQFDREASVMITRDGRDQVRVFPIVENRHKNHILHLTLAPAPHISPVLAEKIDDLATKIALGLDLRGVLGVELFLEGDNVVANELAPRPHNSGHYSIEACNFSQFDAHILSICGLPIPPITLKQPAVMRNLLGDDLTQAKAKWPQHPEWHMHDYGKAEIRPGRKMGHITVTDARDVMDILKQMEAAW
ncbi:5-(carboxyamino)imidazole ribonucleotide synthase [Lacticaseibacillus rhamnosus]|uniref:5-(carboxyamino)imidazole ribonucleotide synthase n=1 Tax=Lacticaseibacillus rhamnosus TaxID=47715 RepID=UPI00065AD37E|nr:5-(carboxyamino)imidazole ribonucleotide synthase [Lacticaseibacillus rhamnosus]KMO45799.1 phosphoribosylaminoimidazole carboxylase [Lacticaseibacillus rhamnosus]OAT97791.1 phosphoribosylaminoimidazole carboxylase [Lacticaseibacillus rhamnosus]